MSSEPTIITWLKSQNIPKTPITKRRRAVVPPHVYIAPVRGVTIKTHKIKNESNGIEDENDDFLHEDCDGNIDERIRNQWLAVQKAMKIIRKDNQHEFRPNRSILPPNRLNWTSVIPRYTNEEIPSNFGPVKVLNS